MNERNKARERWIMIGIPAAVITAILIVGGILFHEPSAEECFKKATQLAVEDRQKSIRRGERNEQKIGRASLRRSEKWYRKAIDKGHPAAHHSLGSSLLVVDRREGLKVLKDGADKGFRNAMFSYAIQAHKDGKITEEEAYEWLHRAKELGHESAREVLRLSGESGRRLPFDDAIQKWMSPQEIWKKVREIMNERR